MCLKIDAEINKRLKKHFESEDSLTVYKVAAIFVDKEDGERWLSAAFNAQLYTKGNNVSSRTTVLLDFDEAMTGEISFGYHFFLNKEDAEIVKNELDCIGLACRFHKQHVVLKISCRKEHFVAGGTFTMQKSDSSKITCESAVFTQFTIEKEQYNRVTINCA